MMPSLEGRRSSKQAENILYKRPHDDGRVRRLVFGFAHDSLVFGILLTFECFAFTITQEDKPIWPKTSTIQEMENAK